MRSLRSRTHVGRPTALHGFAAAVACRRSKSATDRRLMSLRPRGVYRSIVGHFWPRIQPGSLMVASLHVIDKDWRVPRYLVVTWIARPSNELETSVIAFL